VSEPASELRSSLPGVPLRLLLPYAQLRPPPVVPLLLVLSEPPPTNSCCPAALGKEPCRTPPLVGSTPSVLLLPESS
jgi:hypothetical protein